MRLSGSRTCIQETRQRMKIAFIGLGNMGAGIAGCILKAGHDLTVWNRTSAKADPLVRGGAKLGASPAAAAKHADLVITSLMDDASVLDIVRSSLVEAMKPGAIHLCVTTISPACAEELSELHAKTGTRYVSGPVIGRPHAAASGQLLTYLGGPLDAIEAIKEVCDSYAKVVVGLSDQPAAANNFKLIVNYAAISIIEFLGEAYAFAEKCNIDLVHVQQFFQMSFAAPALKEYAEKARKRDFKENVGFAMSAGLKDVRLMLAAAERSGVGFDIGKIIERKMLVALDGDLAKADWSAICEVTRRESGLT